MAIEIKPTKIKETYYLRIPKNIVDLINIDNSSRLFLDLKNSENDKVLEYILKLSK
jgi:hypothetical protein